MQNNENSLAFKLLEAGFDVWLGNNRANIYSRRHLKLKASGAEYFDFSFYEYGRYDLTAMVDYITIYTKQPKISYIGHSLGTSQMFSALSTNQGDLRNKINAFIAFAPVTRLDHTKNDIMLRSTKDLNSLAKWARLFEIHEFFGYGS